MTMLSVRRQISWVSCSASPERLFVSDHSKFYIKRAVFHCCFPSFGWSGNENTALFMAGAIKNEPFRFFLRHASSKNRNHFFAHISAKNSVVRHSIVVSVVVKINAKKYSVLRTTFRQIQLRNSVKSPVFGKAKSPKRPLMDLPYRKYNSSTLYDVDCRN